MLKTARRAAMLAAATMAIGAVAPASAATITFSDLQSGSCAGGSNSVVSGGYTFTANTGNGIFICNPNVVGQNTSAAIVSANGLGVITFAPQNGSAFNLTSFDAGSRTADYNPSMAGYQSATGILVQGLVGANVVASTNFAFSGFTFGTFNLSSAFSGLTSARITATGPNTNAEFVLDNVTVTSAVPEPASWAMMILGMGAVGYALRSAKRRSNAKFDAKIKRMTAGLAA
ncbi:MAG: PEPxxWA-CTERM sorting domain-containing protein [Sphingomonas taxi]